MAWGLFFVYFLLDDALQIHENYGARIATNLSITPPFGLRNQDIGELIVTGIVGVILLSLLLWAYKFGSQAFKKMSCDMLLFVIMTFFFGVVIDMFYSVINMGWIIHELRSFIEDGGEMVVASIICWYTFLLCIREENNTSNLCYFIRSILKRHSTKQPSS
jgi:hypothetical protein